MSEEREYVLGTHDAELERLGLQHDVWRPRASRAWRRAGFTRGQTLLDVGSGPGYATLDLARIVGAEGRVHALDVSQRFLAALSDSARRQGVGNITTHALDLDGDSWPELLADGAWSRWVYAFVTRPRDVLARAAARIRPGGVMVLHEYVDYRAWRLSPSRGTFEGFVAEVMASWRANGGEPDIAMELPRWLEELGFALEHVQPIAEIARPGDFLWQWPKAFVTVGLERLVALGRVDAASARAIQSDFDAAERTPGSWLITPTVLEIVARKR